MPSVVDGSSDIAPAASFYVWIGSEVLSAWSLYLGVLFSSSELRPAFTLASASDAVFSFFGSPDFGPKSALPPLGSLGMNLASVPWSGSQSHILSVLRTFIHHPQKPSLLHDSSYLSLHQGYDIPTHSISIGQTRLPALKKSGDFGYVHYTPRNSNNRKAGKKSHINP